MIGNIISFLMGVAVTLVVMRIAQKESDYFDMHDHDNR
jgi:hypothetical protein